MITSGRAAFARLAKTIGMSTVRHPACRTVLVPLDAPGVPLPACLAVIMPNVGGPVPPPAQHGRR